MHWSTGVPIPRTLEWLGGDIAVVTATSPLRWRKPATRCALPPKRENGYDFASFVVGDGESSATNARAYLYRSADPVIGFAAIHDDDHAHRCTHDAEPKGVVAQAPHSQHRPTVDVIFTADIWRRHGIARALVDAVAADSDVTAADVTWLPPFSDAGLVLAKSIDPNGARLA